MAQPGLKAFTSAAPYHHTGSALASHNAHNHSLTPWIYTVSAWTWNTPRPVYMPYRLAPLPHCAILLA